MTRRGMAPRGICPVCGAERALRANGGMGAHQRAVPSGTGRLTYITGAQCPGTDQPPATGQKQDT